MEGVSKNVVVVGGGFAGVSVIKDLLKRSKQPIKITLVEPLEGFFYRIGVPRGALDEDFGKQLFVPYGKFFPKGVEQIRQYVESVDLEAGLIRLGGGLEPLKYDFVVFSTGRSYRSPFSVSGLNLEEEAKDRWMDLSTTENLLAKFAAYKKQIASSEHVIVVGGGATGIETVAEVHAAFPQKHVTLVHSKPHLLSGQPEINPKQSAKVAATLKELGIEVQLNTHFKLEDQKEGTFVIWSSGSGIPNTKMLPSKVLDDSGLVRVDEHLNIVGYKNAFALGDIASGYKPNAKVAKMQHAPVVAENLTSLIAGKVSKKQVKKLPGIVDSLVVVSLDKDHKPLGFGMLGSMVAGMKQKDMMLAQNVKDLTK